MLRCLPPRGAVCPACAGPLFTVEREGIELDMCPRCRGSWFDRGEVEQLAAIGDAACARLAAHLRRSPAGRLSDRRCPRCRRKLRRAMAGAAAGPVEIDLCPAGCGVFLDAGEFAALTGGDGGPAREFQRWHLHPRRDGAHDSEVSP